jgi:hypothetical protein
LSEKTIERHASGTHVPTRINVTLAVAASQERARFLGNLSGDLSGDSSDLDESTTHPDDYEDHHYDGWDGEPGPDPPNVADHPHNHNHDAEAGGLEIFIQKTWSGCRSDSEDEDEEDGRVQDSDSLGEESEFEWEEKGIRDHLGIDDLIDEDLQRVIAEFSTHLFLLI